MILNQEELIEASFRFRAKDFDTMTSKKKSKHTLYILHAPQDIRLVEGLIVVLTEAVENLSFRWQSGYELDAIQAGGAFDTKEKITASSATLFLATYNSLKDNVLMNLLDFSKSIDKKTYVFPTSYKEMQYGSSLSSTYSMIYIEKLRGVKKTNVKVKFPDNKNIMYTILSEEQLR